MEERKLSQAQIDRLKEYGIKYPWSPWDTLKLLDKLEQSQHLLGVSQIALRNERATSDVFRREAQQQKLKLPKCTHEGPSDRPCQACGLNNLPPSLSFLKDDFELSIDLQKILKKRAERAEEALEEWKDEVRLRDASIAEWMRDANQQFKRAEEAEAKLRERGEELCDPGTNSRPVVRSGIVSRIWRRIFGAR